MSLGKSSPRVDEDPEPDATDEEDLDSRVRLLQRRDHGTKQKEGRKDDPQQPTAHATGTPRT
jgi:hypothetical protein